VLLLGLLQPILKLAVAQEFDLADDCGVDVDQRLHGRDEEGGGTAGRVEQAQVRQHVVQEFLAERGVEIQQQVAHGVERNAAGRRVNAVHTVEDQAVDGALAEVFGDFRPGVVSAEGFLVDVLLEDVAENVGIDLVVIALWRIVQIPRVAAEQREQVFESLIRHGDLGPADFDGVRQE